VCGDEALRTAISLGGPHEGRRTLDGQKGEFLLEGVGHPPGEYLQTLTPVSQYGQRTSPMLVANQNADSGLTLLPGHPP
jgi:hypothetical protein